MKFFSLAFVAALFCAVAVNAAPSSPNLELQLFDEEAFNLVDDVTKVFEDLLEKVKCSVNAIGEVIGESDLKSEFEQFKTAVKTLLQNGVQQCAQTEGLLEKLKCTLNVSQKLAKVFGEFTKQVLATNKELAQKIVKAVNQCSQEEIDVFSLDNEIAESLTFDDEELTFGLVGAITKKLRQLVEKIKCAVRVTGEVIGEGELKKVFLKFRDDITLLLKKDVKECIQTKGLKAKIECTYYTTVKFNKLYKGFIGQVIQTNKDTAALIFLEIKSQCFTSEEPEVPPTTEPEVPSTTEHEVPSTTE